MIKETPSLKKTVNVRHYCNIGDIIASLPGLKKYHEITGNKLIYCQQLNVKATYYPGALHPILKDGQQVMTNEDIWKMIVPLLKSQDYIADAQVYNGQKMGFSEDRSKIFGIDFTVIRQHIFVNMPYMAIQTWLFMAFPDIAADISKAWITLPEKVNITGCKLKYGKILKKINIPDLKNKVLVNFTERYRNQHIDYFFLKNYQNDLIFTGTEKEHELFCKRWELDIPLLIVKDFLQLSYLIKNSKFLLSNQSFCWNVAEAIKTPRLLELCAGAPNCQPFIGEDNYGYLNQVGLVYYFEILISKK